MVVTVARTSFVEKRRGPGETRPSRRRSRNPPTRFRTSTTPTLSASLAPSPRHDVLLFAAAPLVISSSHTWQSLLDACKSEALCPTFDG